MAMVANAAASTLASQLQPMLSTCFPFCRERVPFQQNQAIKPALLVVFLALWERSLQAQLTKRCHMEFHQRLPCDALPGAKPGGGAGGAETSGLAREVLRRGRGFGEHLGSGAR